MPSPEWSQISELLDAVLDLAPEERAAYLDDACRGDEALRAEVEALLDAEANAPDFLDTDAAAVAAPLVAEAPASLEPDPETERVGAYRLVQRIGQGGMSVVYLAERADGPFEQQVALKLLPRYFETESRIARFRAEQQILASLEHPNIARLLDGGVTDAGRPYLVMEHVDGLPITEYCHSHGCSVEERLRLLITVCEVVHHAHRQLVVHRDLKPSNILVTAEGTVKLLDFGIAKLLDEDAAAITIPITQTGEHVMTPEYAAPEQIRGKAITTATDVYQLGILAYELLTDRRPFQVESRSLSAIEQAVLETTPAKPSTAVTRDASKEQEAALPVPPSDWSRRLRGDLDMIVMKALRKESERRYTSAEAFADDLDRHLSGRPVEARPATLGYRTKKFVQRHRWSVAVAALFVTLLIGSLAIIMHQRNIALQERDRATQEAAKSEQVSEFLMSLFEANDPNAAQGATITADTLLRRGQRRAEALRNQPAVQAQMLDVIGEARLSLGQYEQADSLLRRALTMRRSLHGSLDERTMTTQNNLGNVWYAQGQYAAADSLLREVLATARRAGNKSQVAITLNDLGNIAQNQSRYADAEAYHREALALRRQLYDDQSKGVAASLNNIGRALHSQDKLEAAESYYREALALNRALYGPAHSETTITLRNLGQLLVDREQYAEADSMLREVLRIDRKLMGRQHPRIAEDLNELAALAAKREQYAEAERYFREALAIQRRQLGEAHPRIALSLNNLAYALKHQGQRDSVIALKRRALTVAGRSLGPDHVNTAIYMHNLATSLHQADRVTEAERLYRTALQTLREKLPPDHRFLSYPLLELGRLLTETDRASAAEPLLREGLSVTRSAWSADHPKAAEAEAALGHCLTILGQYERAERLLQHSYERLHEAYGDKHTATQEVLQYLSGLYAAQGHTAQARKYRLRAEN